jgi:hypothetical protein
MSELKLQGKPFNISKREVWEAYEKVKANKGAWGGRVLYRGLRSRSEEQLVQDLEQDVLGELLISSLVSGLWGAIVRYLGHG